MKPYRHMIVIVACIVLPGCLKQYRHAQAPSPPAAASAAPQAPLPRNSGADTAAKNGYTGDGMSSPAGSDTGKRLSSASELLLKTIENYQSIAPKSLKIPEILALKASVYYSNGQYEKSREVYKSVIERAPKSAEALEAIRMIAQSFYMEKRFPESQEWYEKLKEKAGKHELRQEANARIAESIFKIAQNYENKNLFIEAASEYERVIRDAPTSEIADRALLNAGIAYEKAREWSRAILAYQRLKSLYPESKLIPEALFKTAKCMERLQQWDEAAQTYLRIAASYQGSEFSRSGLYNAGFCFENAKKYAEAAACFEKYFQRYPQASDGADALFKASELYGVIKDWQNVKRISMEFSRHFGSRKERIIQVQCMLGVALAMQDKKNEAVVELNKTLSLYSSLKQPSLLDRNYAAKAHFTLGDIHRTMNAQIKLRQPHAQYTRQLNEKNLLTRKAVEAYTAVLRYALTEWTLQALFALGQTYEEFGFDIYNQERPPDIPLEKSITLELGIAGTVEEYFIQYALGYYEQNIKLGIKEKAEHASVANALKKITFLPYIAGDYYLSMVDMLNKNFSIRKNAEAGEIDMKLLMLQKSVPFQENAIGLFLKCIELGTRYNRKDDYSKKASQRVSGISYSIGQTYMDVVELARNAPIPGTFSSYERFVYKTKLLKQVEQYEDDALTHFRKTIRIGLDYGISDEYVSKAKERIGRLLFTKGRCNDLLCLQLVKNPPFPDNITSREKDEYTAQFESMGTKYLDYAIKVYGVLMEHVAQNYAAGPFVMHAYARLYQNDPEEYGSKEERLVHRTVTTDMPWKCSTDSLPQWQHPEFDDRTWSGAAAQDTLFSSDVSGFPDKIPLPLWHRDHAKKPTPRAYFRNTFYIPATPESARVFIAGYGPMTVFLNGTPLTADSSFHRDPSHAYAWNIRTMLQQGKNVLAIGAVMRQDRYGVFPYLQYTTRETDFIPRIPNSNERFDKNAFDITEYRFPTILNFEVQ